MSGPLSGCGTGVGSKPQMSCEQASNPAPVMVLDADLRGAFEHEEAVLVMFLGHVL